MSGEGQTEYDARDFLCYQLLEQLDSAQRDGRSITRTQFLKIAPIADRVLSDEYSQNVGLPRYWYMYGEVLNEKPLSGGYYTTTDGPWGGKAIELAPGTTLDAFDVEDDVRRDVHEVARKLANDFANESTDDLKTYQYREYAPTDFITAFDEFRDFISETGQQSVTLDRFTSDQDSYSRETEALELLDDVLVEYPETTYEEMHDVFLEWEDTTRLLLEQETSFDEIGGLLSDFWETFSKVELRLRHEQNTPQEQKLQWLDERGDVKREFRERLSGIQEEALTARESSNVLDSVAGSYSETAQNLFEGT